MTDQIRQQLGESDATQETRNRFRLRRPSSVAEYELRVRDWRVFYRVVDRTVQVALIGRKVQEEIQENRADRRTTTTVERRCGPPGSAPR